MSCAVIIQSARQGYTTSSGDIKPHLESFHLFSHHQKSDLQKIVDTDTIQVVPVALASDGSALKPGLEYDRPEAESGNRTCSQCRC